MKTPNQDRYIIAQKALASFHEGIKTFHESTGLPADVKQDSLLKRFALATDTFWRYVEVYLQQQDVDLQMYGPNKLLLACADNSVVSDEQYCLFVSMIQDRLLEPLGLDTDLMNEVAKRVPEYYPAMQEALDKIKPLA